MGTHRAIQAISCGQGFKPLVFLQVSRRLGQGIPAAFFLAVLNLFSACDEEGGTPVVPDNPSPRTVNGFSAAAADSRNSMSWVNPTGSGFTGDLILPRDYNVFSTGPVTLRTLESLWKGCGVVIWSEHLFAVPQIFTK